MADQRRSFFIDALPNNFHEWDTILGQDAGAHVWQDIKAPTLVLRARETARSVSEIFEIWQEMCPHWEYREIAEGGHMAPVTRPDIVNPIVMDFIRQAVQASVPFT